MAGGAQGGGQILARWQFDRGINAAVVFIMTDSGQAHRAFLREQAGNEGARGLGGGAVSGATPAQFGRIDIAQPDQNGQILARISRESPMIVTIAPGPS